MSKPLVRIDFVITFITEKKMKEFGYNEKRFDYPIFVYMKENFCYTMEHWLVPEYMIEKSYSISKAEHLFPEMFL